MSAGEIPYVSAVRLALAVKRLRAERSNLDLAASDPIAIVGMGCRFPAGSNSPEEFWEALKQGRDGIREVPEGRWKQASALPAHLRRAGFLDPVDEFDADYFGISPREARQMDPQQRLLLEVVWEALWDAGIEPESLTGAAVGVFVAIYNGDYARMNFSDPSTLTAHASMGTAHHAAAGRISFLLNLHGPALAVDSACSSSLTALHLACQSLRARECGMAIVGAASMKLLPDEFIMFSHWGALSHDSRCKTFDAAADGFASGEGAGSLILKSLADALEAGDRVRAVIRGSAVNQDGRTTVLTAPSGLAQEAVLRAALANARVRPEQVDYIETHGTGTALGDPIEVEAIASVYGGVAPGVPRCVLGAVKTNLGHLEAAAGLAGTIKAALCLEHGEIPRNLHFQSLNPEISLDRTRLSLAVEEIQWPQGERPRLAGISSFGATGTNSHVILEEAPRLPAGHAATRKIPLPARRWERRKFWFEEPTASTGRPAPAAIFAGANTSGGAAESAAALHGPDRIDGSNAACVETCVLVWRAVPLAAQPQVRRDGERWLLVESRAGIMRELRASLERQGAMCETIADVDFRWEEASKFGSAGDAQSDSHPGAYPGSHPGWTAVLYDARGLGAQRSSANPDSVGWAHPEKNSVRFLLQFAKYAGSRDARPPRLWVISSSGAAVLPREDVAVETAPLQGLILTLALEHPETAPVAIDLAPEIELGSDLDVLVAAELAAGGAEPRVAFRHGTRYVARLERLEKSENETFDWAADLVDGTALITGGLGALGAETARWLAAKGARHIVLAGRTAEEASNRPLVAELRECGVDAAVLRADVASFDECRKLLGTIRATQPPLRAIFHCAGIVQDALLENESWDSYLQATASKIQGSWNLDRLTREDPICLTVLYSSGASVFGSQAQGSYAAGNAFLDTLAHARASRGLRTLSVNWGAWGSSGMAARLKPELAARLARQGIVTMAPKAALVALDAAIVSGAAQVSILSLDWRKYAAGLLDRQQTWLSTFLEAEPDSAAKAAEGDGARLGAGLLDALRLAPAAERRAMIAAHVKTCARHVLGLDPEARIDQAVPLQEVGLDSLMALEMRNELAASLGIPLPAGLLFDYPAVEQLSGRLLELLQNALLPAGEERSVDAIDGSGEALDALSEEEAERLLLEELNGAGTAISDREKERWMRATIRTS